MLTPLSIALLSLSMSADSFAAAVGRGASHRPKFSEALKAGAVFGIIEAITPLIGWVLGILAAGYVAKVDHWIAFGLLVIVGGHMIYEALKRDATSDYSAAIKPRAGGLIALIALAVATSLDAGAVGIGLALIGTNIWIVAASVGITTFALATLGMMIGAKVGERSGKAAEAFGGLILISIGSLILYEHLSAAA